MPFAISSQAPTNHPLYVPVQNPADTQVKYIYTNNTQGGVAVLGVPNSVNADGKKFIVRASGHLSLKTGSSPGTFNFYITNGAGIGNTYQNLYTVAYSLPANANGVAVPFLVEVECVWDSLAKTIFYRPSYIFGSTASSVASWSRSAVAVDASQLQFFLQYFFTVAPLAGTTVEITNFVLG